MRFRAVRYLILRPLSVVGFDGSREMVFALKASIRSANSIGNPVLFHRRRTQRRGERGDVRRQYIGGFCRAPVEGVLFWTATLCLPAAGGTANYPEQVRIPPTAGKRDADRKSGSKLPHSIKALLVYPHPHRHSPRRRRIQPNQSRTNRRLRRRAGTEARHYPCRISAHFRRRSEGNGG